MDLEVHRSLFSTRKPEPRAEKSLAPPAELPHRRGVTHEYRFRDSLNYNADHAFNRVSRSHPESRKTKWYRSGLATVTSIETRQFHYRQVHTDAQSLQTAT